MPFIKNTERCINITDFLTALKTYDSFDIQTNSFVMFELHMNTLFRNSVKFFNTFLQNINYLSSLSSFFRESTRSFPYLNVEQ